eukprot:13023780-Ditylum_brightwellii.AAC.1
MSGTDDVMNSSVWLKNRVWAVLCPSNIDICAYITCWLRDRMKFGSDCSETTVEAVEKLVEMLLFF